MEIALEVAYWKICKVDINKTAGVVNLNFLKFISMSTEILDLLSISIKSIFLPLLNNSPEIKAQIIEMTNSQIQKMEILINIILQETITVISTKFSAILCKQKKMDFVPKSQELLDQDTLPAIEIVNILNLIFEQSSKFLKGKLTDIFNVDWGRVIRFTTVTLFTLSSQFHWRCCSYEGYHRLPNCNRRLGSSVLD